MNDHKHRFFILRELSPRRTTYVFQCHDCGRWYKVSKTVFWAGPLSEPMIPRS